MSGECESEAASIAAPFIFCGGYAGLDSQFGTDIFHYMRVAGSEQSQAITDYTKKLVNGVEELPQNSRLENLLRVTYSGNIKYKILDVGNGYYAITYNVIKKLVYFKACPFRSGACHPLSTKQDHSVFDKIIGIGVSSKWMTRADIMAGTSQ